MALNSRQLKASFLTPLTRLSRLTRLTVLSYKKINCNSFDLSVNVLLEEQTLNAALASF